jgi:hypothetical protein
MNTVTWDLEDWQVAFDEHAARLEYDEGLSRLQAEALARKWVMKLRGNLQGLKTSKVSFAIDKRVARR